MVHDEHNRRVVRYVLNDFIISCSGPHLVDRVDQQTRHACPEAEIRECAETRHDFTRITTRLFEPYVFGNAMLVRVVHDLTRDVRVIDQALDHIIAPCELERLYGAHKTRVEARHRTLKPSSKKPAH